MFSITAYEGILKLIKDAGYSFNSDLNCLENNQCFLRHDIDFSIDMALEIAKFEHSISINSTFFFMLSSNMYNLLSYDSITKVQEIRSLGHTISLHFDPDCYEDFIEGFEIEKKVFEDVFNISIDVVSIHRPGKFLNNNDIKLPGVLHTYESKFFKQIAYVSDSAGIDPLKRIIDFLEGVTNEPLQLLTHPIWWCEKSESTTSTLNKWFEQRNKFIKNEITLNCRTYKG